MNPYVKESLRKTIKKHEANNPEEWRRFSNTYRQLRARYETWEDAADLSPIIAAYTRYKLVAGMDPPYGKKFLKIAIKQRKRAGERVDL